MRYILGNLALIDVLHGPLRFRFRLHPTNMVARLGVDLTGKFVDEMEDGRQVLLATKIFTEVIETRRPVVENLRGFKTDHRTWNCEILVLPLSSTGSTIDMLMGCVVWDEVDPLQPPAGTIAVSGTGSVVDHLQVCASRCRLLGRPLIRQHCRNGCQRGSGCSLRRAVP